MANYSKLLLHFFMLLFFSLLILELASSARPFNGATFHPVGEENNGSSSEINSGGIEANHGKLAYGPSLIMSMLPKGKLPVSGPSRRINGANN